MCFDDVGCELGGQAADEPARMPHPDGARRAGSRGGFLPGTRSRRILHGACGDEPMIGTNSSVNSSSHSAIIAELCPAGRCTGSRDGRSKCPPAEPSARPDGRAGARTCEPPLVMLRGISHSAGGDHSSLHRAGFRPSSTGSGPRKKTAYAHGDEGREPDLW